ncbi:hypothetical protein D039_4655B, partial [Vibrio parahaemolyticus EKP-028]
ATTYQSVPSLTSTAPNQR